MNSEVNYEGSASRKETSHFNKLDSVEFTLSYDQYIIIQHFLPKRYALLERKPSKKGGHGGGSATKMNHHEENFSRVSGNVQNTDMEEGRSKRPKPKKSDRFLESQISQKPLKRASQKLGVNLNEQMMECYNILQSLKRHKSSFIFHQPVDPELDNCHDYLSVIKEPMDLSTVEAKLKGGEYENPTQFHADLNKIWNNSYHYNAEQPQLLKYTSDFEKYYKNLMLNNGNATSKKSKSSDKNKSRDSKPHKKEQSVDKVSEKGSQSRDQKKSTSVPPQEGFDVNDSNDFLNDK